MKPLPLTDRYIETLPGKQKEESKILAQWNMRFDKFDGETSWYLDMQSDNILWDLEPSRKDAFTLRKDDKSKEKPNPI